MERAWLFLKNIKATKLKAKLISHLEDIEEGLAKGYSKKQILEAMIKDDLLKKTTDYAYFVRVLNSILNDYSNKTFPKKINQQAMGEGFTMTDLGEDDFK